MKSLISIVATLLFLSLVSCSKKDESDTGKDPKSTASIATYKGVLLGSTGYFTVELGEEKSTAQLVIDHETFHIESTRPIDPDEDITDYKLEKDSTFITISVGKDRKHPQIEIVASGHPNIITTIYEDTEEQPVENYIGWSKSENDSFYYEAGYNLSICGNQFTIIEKTTATNQANWFSSTIIGTIQRSNGNIHFNFTVDGQTNSITAVEQGDKITYFESWDNGNMQFELTKVNE